MTGIVPIRANNAATASAVTDGGAVETVVLTSAPVSTPAAGATVNLEGQVNITPGTSATAVVITVRRSTVTGTVVGSAETETLAAGAKGDIPFVYNDTPGEVAGLVYVVTVTETGAVANGTVNYASIQATLT